MTHTSVKPATTTTTLGTVIVLGPLCIGKGYIFENAFKIPYGEDAIPRVEMGALIRERLRSDPDFEKMFKDVVIKGDLIPDDIALEMMRTKRAQLLENGRKGLYLDGIPRNVDQFHDLHHRKLISTEHTLVFSLKGSDETCQARFENRHNIRGEKRPDAKAYKNRLEISKRDLPPLVSAMRAAGYLVVDINANHPLPTVARDIVYVSRNFLGQPEKAPGTPERTDQVSSHARLATVQVRRTFPNRVPPGLLYHQVMTAPALLAA